MLSSVFGQPISPAERYAEAAPTGSRSNAGTAGSHAGVCLRKRPGGCPKSRLNAAANANSEAYPTCRATEASGASVSESSRAASVKRQEVK